MTMELRTYQREAVAAVYQHLRERDDNPCVVIPTGGGKTPVMATICTDAVGRWGGRVLVLAHVKELLQQTRAHLIEMAPDLDIGVYSAGLKRRDTDHPVIVAGIQSVYRRADELDRFDLVLIDEAHMIPPEGDGMYRQFLADAHLINPHLRTIGLTATPFRMNSGYICRPDHFLNAICYEIGVKELIRDGYLCPLRSKAGAVRADTSGLHVRGGEYIATEVEDLMDEDELVRAACAELVEQTRDRKSVLIFASGVKHGRHVKSIIENEHGLECGFVCGRTPTNERDHLLARFRGNGQAGLFDEGGPLRYLCNVNVLTTGFDAPNIDCVAMLRPTLSPGLFYQMCLDMETEVLTRDGWRRCHQVTTGDEVAAFDMDVEEVAYVPALDKVHRALRRHESMFGVSAPHLDIRVTDQHNLVVRSKSRSAKYWHLQAASDVALRRDSYTIPVAGKGRRFDTDAPLTDAEVSFLGWFLTDGYHNQANGTIHINQSVTKYVDRIRAVLNAAGFGFREYRIPRTGRHAEYEDNVAFLIPHGQPRGENREKRGWADLALWIDKDVPAIYDTLSTRQFHLLLKAMDRANGRHPVGLGYRTRTMSIALGCRQRLADRIQQLAVERGYRCNIAEQDPKPTDWNAHPQRQWQIHIRKQQVAYIGGTNHQGNSTVRNRCRLEPVDFKPNEWVWCLTTEKGTLVTRRNGKVAILGNCGRGFRMHPGKDDCLVLDFAGNILRHGPVDQIRIREPDAKGSGEAPAKECPECHAVVAAGYAICPECGYEFPPPE
ncbi:MAG: DEAD/DEAH box helicase family protein, partial [Planctomycetota bacterium]